MVAVTVSALTLPVSIRSAPEFNCRLFAAVTLPPMFMVEPDCMVALVTVSAPVVSRVVPALAESVPAVRFPPRFISPPEVKLILLPDDVAPLVVRLPELLAVRLPPAVIAPSKRSLAVVCTEKSPPAFPLTVLDSTPWVMETEPALLAKETPAGADMVPAPVIVSPDALDS